ncbi:MAG: transcriptional regulator NrdR [Candidatus Sumerlaeota bacterium]|nr:transcriptional regulator NrdR [Candidatus Sumerlaeota bacterium]
MRCPFCGTIEDRVVNSRETQNGESIRRRRECLNCSKRWTTFEIIEKVPFMVIKRDGRRAEFDPQKLLRGIQRACHKRPVPVEDMEQIVRYVERELQNSMEREFPSTRIGELVLKRLRDLDEVAYMRYASVFHYFHDIGDFRDTMARLLKQD